ncbi:MAG: hypothetical protein F6K28_07485 [Microcoleus sp. SIO2G3]|nr:hypothetical protein [Microcoleus sp. SIO2G3]
MALRATLREQRCFTVALLGISIAECSSLKTIQVLHSVSGIATFISPWRTRAAARLPQAVNCFFVHSCMAYLLPQSVIVRLYLEA